jgi:hypothetical protein
MNWRSRTTEYLISLLSDKLTKLVVDNISPGYAVSVCYGISMLQILGLLHFWNNKSLMNQQLHIR